MQIIIVGDGKVGVALTEQLSSEGHDITVIDSNPKVLEQSLESYDVMVVHGNGASIGVLKEAGVEDAHLLIAATSRDETNLLTCIVAKKLGAKHTIARVRNPEYAEQLVLMRDELGLSMTINPELAAAREIQDVYKRQVRRHAPARDDRHCAGMRAQAADRRRADHRPGRDHTGSDPGADDGPEGKAGHGHHHDHP